MSKWRSGCILFISLCFGLGMLVFHNLRDTFRFIENQAALEAWIDTALPTGAHDVRIESYRAPFNYRIWLRFDAPPGALLDDFLAGLGFDLPLEARLNPVTPHLLEGAPAWWQPGEMQDFSGGVSLLRGDAVPKRDYVVLIDQSSPDLWRVYVYIYDDV